MLTINHDNGSVHTFLSNATLKYNQHYTTGLGKTLTFRTLGYFWIFFSEEMYTLGERSNLNLENLWPGYFAFV